MAVSLRIVGKSLKGLPLREKELFSDGEVPTAINREGGGVKALMALPLKNDFFCGFLRRL